MPKMNYRYFRHRLDASDDPKLQTLIDEMGIVALGYYYSLLEIYGKHYDDKKENGAVLIHRRVIANTWRKRVDSCDKVLTKLQLSDLLVYTKCENTYSIDIPNFPKYYGYYGNNTLDKSSKESKVKKSKVKEIKKEQKSKFDLEEIYANYPRKEGKSAGIKKLTQVIKNQVEYDSVLQGAKDYKKHCEINETEKRYIKIFSSWVNQECWKDTYDTVSAEEDLKNWLDGEIEKGLGVENVPQRIHE
jgi:hypothetical protein